MNNNQIIALVLLVLVLACASSVVTNRSGMYPTMQEVRMVNDDPSELWLNGETPW